MKSPRVKTIVQVTGSEAIVLALGLTQGEERGCGAEGWGEGDARFWNVRGNVKL